ncbi:hypothetical protein CEE60_07345 [Stenotrophomonas maltophilia]|uniref:Uncharacterized protein n=1 Tax=Stenotrophomonas maltophilia TaxID=40324 RepID=A0A2D0AK30_STEMA|nr:hypothetical protein [Stenotrophomonas maltophilia]OWQ54801.1 hypothetical protein CEE60_07345 [Stenotrophomonas maltophilia]
MSYIEKRARELLAAEVDRDAVAMPGVEEVATSIRKGGHGSVQFVPTALRAIIAALTPPEGYVLVPVEPTEAMLQEIHLVKSFTGEAMHRRYAAMIAARPEVLGG